MSIIQKLPPEVASRIAAGEVAERPYNVVKELIENSVDAGASKITVEIADGGLSLIRISDNGKGMSADDLPLALERFATSKARSVEDVYSALTFGFRGEALAAVSSVSDFTLTSGTDSGKTFEIKSKYGVIGDVKPAAAIKGTVAEVVNLFENVPARRKFLKGTRSLESEIIKLIKHFSLINPNIEIILYSNGKLVYEAYSHEDICIRASKVFAGKGFCKGLLEYGSYKVTVAATLPAVSDRLKRDAIILGVNGRLIKDTSLIQAVIKAYHRLIPEGRFPAVTVDIRMNPDEVDANVHPAKLEVRFEKPKDIFCIVSDAVAKSFEGQGIVCDYEHEEVEEQIRPLSSVNDSVAVLLGYQQAEKPKPQYTVDLSDLEKSDDISLFDNPVMPIFDAKLSVSEYVEKDSNFSSDMSATDNLKKQEKISFKIIGQVADSFIICETSSNDIMFIDQHAAHERILFEKAQQKEKIERVSIVLHDVIYVTLTDEQMDSVFENRDVIENYGYSFNKVNENTLEITRIPHAAVRGDVSKSFSKIVSELYIGGHSKTEDAPRALLSCKSAIKAGDKLTEIEMKYLVDLLFDTSNYGTCPHGRPIIYTMSINELSRKFLR